LPRDPTSARHDGWVGEWRKVRFTVPLSLEEEGKWGILSRNGANRKTTAARKFYSMTARVRKQLDEETEIWGTGVDRAIRWYCKPLVELELTPAFGRYENAHETLDVVALSEATPGRGSNARLKRNCAYTLNGARQRR